MREKHGLNVMSQYRPCIPGKCHVVNKLFPIIKARLWKCYLVTIVPRYHVAILPCSFQS